MFSDLLSRVIH